MLEKFENLSKSLDETYNTQTVVSCLRDFFRKNFNTDDLKIYKFIKRFFKNVDAS